MASREPSSSPSRTAVAIGAAIALAGLAGAIFTPFRGPMIAIGMIAGMFAVITFRALPRTPKKKKKRGKNAPFIVMVPKEDDEMFSVLDSLGIPVDGTGGNAKAAIYRGYKLLTTGHANEGVDTLRSVTSSLDEAPDPAMRRVAAVAHYLIGKAYEAAGNRGEAMTELDACIRLAPDYLMHRTADGRETEH